jgi:phosphate/sulfate permease
MLASFAQVVLRIRNAIPASTTAAAVRSVLGVMRVARVLVIQLLLLLLVVPIFLRLLARVLLLLMIRTSPLVALFGFLLLLRHG